MLEDGSEKLDSDVAVTRALNVVLVLLRGLSCFTLTSLMY